MATRWGRWAEMADPSFDFPAAFEDFAAKIKLPAGVAASVRGSRVGELVARCVVECGTSSMYSALAGAAEEPVLKQICLKYRRRRDCATTSCSTEHKKRYLEIEKVGRLRRFWVALTRATEMEDDELAYAYYAANRRGSAEYDRKAAKQRICWPRFTASTSTSMSSVPSRWCSRRPVSSRTAASAPGCP